jgi:imidazolonepropionase-like amidohydrolase
LAEKLLEANFVEVEMSHHSFFSRLISFVGIFSLLIGCSSAATLQPNSPATARAVIEADLALVNAILIDGTGANPLPNAVLLIKGERIVAVGPRKTINIAPDTKTIDLRGATILPGFINAHVHFAFDETNLEAWAQGGVTTVRDEGITSGKPLAELMAFRDKTRANPKYARLVSAGYMTTVPSGYGQLFVSSPEDAREKVTEELDAGVDLLKISLEDGYAGRSGLPKLTDDEIAAIVSVAHQRGTRVSGHITQGAYLERMVNAGVDDVAHIPYDYINPEVLKKMIAKDIYFTPTFTVFRNYGAPVSQCVENLRQFLKLGGHAALGNDYGGGPGKFELGIPMYEIEQMTKAGMTPMQIIVASTLNAAHAANIEKELGTLGPGKFADILVVTGDPLTDLQALKNVQMVIHNGVIIRQQN